jgi:hypothetical protein
MFVAEKSQLDCSRRRRSRRPQTHEVEPGFLR